MRKNKLPHRWDFGWFIPWPNQTGQNGQTSPSLLGGLINGWGTYPVMLHPVSKLIEELFGGLKTQPMFFFVVGRFFFGDFLSVFFSRDLSVFSKLSLRHFGHFHVAGYKYVSFFLIDKLRWWGRKKKHVPISWCFVAVSGASAARRGGKCGEVEKYPWFWNWRNSLGGFF